MNSYCLLFYKPVNCTPFLKKDKLNIFNFLPKDKTLVPVDRLDFKTSGLMLVSNDRDILNGLKKKSMNRKYLVDAKAAEFDLKLLQSRKTVFIDGKQYSFDVELIRENGKFHQLEFSIQREPYGFLRKVALMNRFKPVKIVRTEFGMFRIGKMMPGAYRTLSMKEMQYIQGILNGE